LAHSDRESEPPLSEARNNKSARSRALTWTAAVFTPVLVGVVVAWLSPGGLFSSPASSADAPLSPGSGASVAPSSQLSSGPDLAPPTVDQMSTPPPTVLATPTPNRSPGATSRPTLPVSPVQTNQPAPTGNIHRPINGQMVPVQVNDVTGTVERVPEHHVVWLVAQIIGPAGNPYFEALQRAEPRLWPGPVPVTMRDDKTWTTFMYFGANAPQHAGLQFRLYLVIVDRAVDGQFRTYNQNAQQLGYQGIELRHVVAPVIQLATVDVVRS
jgi:hypothetical protein